MKSGFIAILGRPNVGKSSLMNALVGEKISIVSPKSQTTRDRITGIRTDGDCQMIFVDTPGLHEARTALGEQMNRAARTAGTDADVTVVVLDGTKKPTDRDFAFIERQLKTDRPVYVVVNKTIWRVRTDLSDAGKAVVPDPSRRRPRRGAGNHTDVVPHGV